MNKFTLSVLALGGVAFAADCQQARQDGDPTGSQIATALTSNSLLDTVCAGTWRTGDDEKLENTWNHGSIVYSITREDNTKDLTHCQEAFNNIIDQCISNDNYWSGSWSLDGETYSISNSVYPENGLASTDDGGPQASSTITTFATSTTTIDGLTTNSETTTTIDGHVTILPIWLVGPGIGIILIPAAGVAAGVPVPVPAGYPTLTIGDDGKAHTSDSSSDANQSDPTSMVTSTTTTSACESCTTCADFDILGEYAVIEDDGNPDVAAIDPTVWAALSSQYPLFTIATTTAVEAPSMAAAVATQPANPIDEPTCADASDDIDDDLAKWTSKGTGIQLSDGQHKINDILYMLRTVTGSQYETEHVFEKHIIKYFFYHLLGNGAVDPVATCADVQTVFTNTNAVPNNLGNNFMSVPAAQQLASAVSCKGGRLCPADRSSEFFLLRKEVNGAKSRVFAGYQPTGSSMKLPSCSDEMSYLQIQQQMIDVALVFKYMNTQAVFDSFNAVHLRIREIMANLDADDLGSRTPPRHLDQQFWSGGRPTWLAAYDSFIQRFMEDSDLKMLPWLDTCRTTYKTLVNASTKSQGEKNDLLEIIEKYGSGMDAYADDTFDLQVKATDRVRIFRGWNAKRGDTVSVNLGTMNRHVYHHD
ncbi:hypothetical protein G7Z17_g6355 [Cylindrodendrum hubeiense]|uniref:Uncharacterized protein n=1 Tax=Cylindrodendrum hubeiense TaxID=595255 RepID=A0A9P5L8A8_9HYPO|nr:hypothetical protein G7Z17_g6355 [Cylindrodendrum hubeiense]